ncbi:MAG: LmeA family phospholipid-binding protein [Micromonosporaceae bacterium]
MANGSRKAGIGLLVIVLVLLGVVVAADRGAAWAAEGRISEQVAEKAAERDIAMQGEPEVTVEGFPFLTQVFGGEYQAITIVMRKLSVDGVTVERLDVRATTVKAELSDVMNGTGEIRAGHVTGEATVPFAAVEEVIGIEGGSVDGADGKLLIHVPFDYGSGSIRAVAVASVKVKGTVLHVDVESIRPEKGKLPSFAQSALDDYAGELSRDIKLPKLPYDMKITSAKVTGAGVVAVAEADNVPLTS